MCKIILYGAGKSLQPILETIIDKEMVQVIVDNNVKKIGTMLKGISIISPYEISKFDYNYVVVATVHYKLAVDQLEMLGVTNKKIVLFYDEKTDFSQFIDIFKLEKAQWESFHTRMNVQMKDFMQKQKLAMENMEFEVAEKIIKREYQFPIIATVKDTVEKIIRDKVSISRYGDGEFEIIAGHAKDVYQKDDEDLKRRLQEILLSDVSNHIVALTDDFGDLAGKNSDIQYSIRKYMTKGKRKFLKTILDMEKQYYNAYISRPYSLYDEYEVERSSRRFSDLKRIWDKRDVVFIEGGKTRMGVNNDLFSNACSIQRIIAPDEHAYSQYDILLAEAKKLDRTYLFLIALGPAATVLSYDLAKDGYQAIDIGHLDLEYEWFLKGKGQTYIPHKYNNEVYGDDYVVPILDGEYDQQIITVIK